jgi:hypothetical protein
MTNRRRESETRFSHDRPARPRILLVGDPPSRTGIAAAFRSALAARSTARGWQVEEIILDEAALKPCTGCLTCYRSSGGTCVHADGYRPLREVARQMDCLVLLTEITFGQASVAIKQAIDKGIGVPWGLCGPFPTQLIVGYGGELLEDEASCFLDVVRRHMGKAEELHLPCKGCVVDAQIVLKPGDIDPTLEVLEGFVDPAPAVALPAPRGSGALSPQVSATVPSLPGSAAPKRSSRSWRSPWAICFS